ncbi:MAG: 4-hydroxy-tetrahydrodipicolinate synthase [bacterium]|nr:4-hydroxy-tetrahydrodipicolinate synthase [bacterium]
MKKRLFTGCGTAIITPMNPDNSVNFSKFSELIDEQINSGVDAIIVCGTTGESATLSNDEHIEVIKCAVETCNKRVPIISGTGSNDTNYAATLSKEAQELGVDGLLMVTPYYNKTSQVGLINHYNYVADRVDIPIIVYNVPSRTGVNIKPETYFELAKHKNIVAIKEANGDLSSIAKTRALCGDSIDIYSGNDDQIVPILSLGGIGVISVLSNIAPKVTHDICKYFFDGDIEKSRNLQLEYISLIDALFADVNPIPVKYAMNLMGKQVGNLRLPLCDPNESVQKLLLDELKKHNLI